MANEEHLDILKQGVDVWNAWRAKNPKVQPDLSKAQLHGNDLHGIDLKGANISGTCLIAANLMGAYLWFADLHDCELHYADLRNADLSSANLIKSSLQGARLADVNLSGAHLRFADLSEAHLNGANLRNADLRAANLNTADLTSADLTGADLSFAHLIKTCLRSVDLSQAHLRSVDFGIADLSGANLSNADLSGANFSEANLQDVDFVEAIINGTVFGGNDLKNAKGLDKIIHLGPSTIGIDTIYRSNGNIPEVFLKRAGVPDSFITYIRSLVGKPIKYYTCFVSYSSKDEAFAQRLYTDLQSHNVRCWFAPEDLKIGDKFRHRIDESIRVYDKLLIVLSEASLASTWVGYEVEKALDKEPEGVPNVLFPIRLDKAILSCETDWAKDIRKSRHIGDFEHWKDHDAYQIAIERLLRDLKAQS